MLALVLIAGTWGALNTAALHRHQAADLERMAANEAAWYDDIRARTARYARPSLDVLPYWQDPTDAAGFSRYFLRRFAAKPHLPLSALSVGQSDVQPFAVPLRLETLFGGDRVYDFEPPRGLATGPFDLGFVLTFVLPLCLGAAAATVGAEERDHGILYFVAAQPITARRWWLLRVTALMAVLAAGVSICVVFALAATGARILDVWPQTLAAVALVTVHVLFWLAIAGSALARGHGAVSTVSIVAGVWLALTIGVPLAGTIAARVIVPPPSPIADVNELRRKTDEVQSDADAVVARRLAAHVGPTAQSIDPAALDYSTRLILITEEMEERLQAQERRRQEHARAVDRLTAMLRWISPQLAFHIALADLAGTGTARHERFVDAVRSFQLELRRFMYPRVLKQVRTPPFSVCSGCPGRLNFVDYDRIPRFNLLDPSASSLVRSALQTAAWLVLLAIAIAMIGIGRVSNWAI